MHPGHHGHGRARADGPPLDPRRRVHAQVLHGVRLRERSDRTRGRGLEERPSGLRLGLTQKLVSGRLAALFPSRSNAPTLIPRGFVSKDVGAVGRGVKEPVPFFWRQEEQR